MFCIKCGKELEDGYTFCPNCGTPQQNNVVSQTEKTSKQTESITINKSILKKGILIAVVVIILICVVFTISSLSSGKENVGTQNTTSAVSKQKTVEVVGKWKDEDSTVVFTLDKDNTGEMVSGGWAIKFTWEYNKSTRALTLDFDMLDLPGKLTYNSKDDTLVFTDGSVLTRVS